MNKSSREQFTMTLEAMAGDSRPAVARLRQLLKLALRGFKLKCVRLSGTELEPVWINPSDLGDK